MTFYKFVESLMWLSVFLSLWMVFTPRLKSWHLPLIIYFAFTWVFIDIPIFQLPLATDSTVP